MRKNVNNSILFGYIRYILLRKLVKRGSKSKTRAGIGFFHYLSQTDTMKN